MLRACLRARLHPYELRFKVLFLERSDLIKMSPFKDLGGAELVGGYRLVFSMKGYLFSSVCSLLAAQVFHR